MKHIIYIALMAAWTAGCTRPTQDQHNAHNHAQESSPQGHNHGDGSCSGDAAPKEEYVDEIVFTQTQALAAKIQVKTVLPGRFSQVIKTAGQIQAAQGDEQTIIATANGVVSFASPAIVEGAGIRAGQGIVSISAKGLSDGDPTQRARIAYETAQSEYKRAEALLRDTIISQKDFARIRLEYRQAQEAYLAQTAKLSSHGIVVSSPIAGFVKTRLVGEGQYVTTGQAIAIISQNRKLQLKADVSEKHFRTLSTITSANFRTPYDKTIYKLSDLGGRLLSYGRSSDGASFYVPITFEFDNIGQMIPGSFVEIFLLSTPEDNVISVPLTALIEEQGVYSVIVQTGQDTYRKQEIQTGEDDGLQIRILSGLNAGDRIVTQGAMQIKLAAGASSMPHGHTH